MGSDSAEAMISLRGLKELVTAKHIGAKKTTATVQMKMIGYPDGNGTLHWSLASLLRMMILRTKEMLAISTNRIVDCAVA